MKLTPFYRESTVINQEVSPVYSVNILQRESSHCFLLTAMFCIPAQRRAVSCWIPMLLPMRRQEHVLARVPRDLTETPTTETWKCYLSVCVIALFYRQSTPENFVLGNFIHYIREAPQWNSGIGKSLFSMYPSKGANIFYLLAWFELPLWISPIVTSAEKYRWYLIWFNLIWTHTCNTKISS